MKYSREETRLNLRMLIEEEELDLGLDDEEDDEPADTGDTPESSDDEAADDKGDTETEEEEDIKISDEDEKVLYNPLEAQVDAMLADFENDALRSAKVNEVTLSMLVETDVNFDVNAFAENTARLIDSYTTLLDIEAAIYYRAAAILEKNYGHDVSEAFKELMQQQHGYDFGDVRPDPVKSAAPLAVGAGGGGGGGA